MPQVLKPKLLVIRFEPSQSQKQSIQSLTLRKSVMHASLCMIIQKSLFSRHVFARIAQQQQQQQQKNNNNNNNKNNNSSHEKEVDSLVS